MIADETQFYEKQMAMSISPPYKRVRSLRLFDVPVTPKTLIEKSAAYTPIRTGKLNRHVLEKPRSVAAPFHPKMNSPAANVNPYTPTGMKINARRRSSSKRSRSRCVILRRNSKIFIYLF